MHEQCQLQISLYRTEITSLWELIALSEQKARRIQAQWLFSSSLSPPSSTSHTAYPATFGTSFSLLGFSHLGHWHKINEDTKKTQGSELEGVGGWGVKLLGCKIALAAVLLFQHFMESCSTSVPILACLVPSSLHLFFSPFVFLSTLGRCWVWPSLSYFIKCHYGHLSCLVCRLVLLWPEKQSNGVFQFCPLGGGEQKVLQANIHTLICPKKSNCSPAAFITCNQSQGG